MGVTPQAQRHEGAAGTRSVVFGTLTGASRRTRPLEGQMLKKILAALGITGALYWVTKKRQQGDEFKFTEHGDQ